MPYIPFTDEQKVLANSVNLEEFLRMRGEKLERVGREHKLIYYDSSGKHDSITLRGSTWFDHKNQVGGGAIKFMQEFYDMDWFCQYHLTHFIRTRIMQRERYDHSRAFFGLPEADHRWRCRFFCWPSNSYNISRS